MSRAMQRGGRAAQRGNVVAIVSVMGVAGTMALTAVMNSTVVLEERAIDAHLAEVRAYWGATGQFRYVLARTRYSGACEKRNDDCRNILWTLTGNARDDDKEDALQAYLDEIGGYRMLTYREEPSAYFIRLSVGDAREDDTPGKHSRSGHMMVTTGLSGTQSTLPVLANLAPRLPRFEMRFCVGLPSASASCGPIGSNNNSGSYTTHYSVKRLTRLPL